jgi:asparagine synthetase B (glutamine-hydrolysing)
MCGISGIALWRNTALTKAEVTATLDAMFRLSERRGKEAAGIAVRTQESLSIFKRPMRASRMIRTNDYRVFVKSALAETTTTPLGLAGPLATIGHARLVTNGRHGIAGNNQPVASSNAVAVHNGIVVNDACLWHSNSGFVRHAEVDTEILPTMLSHALAAGEDLTSATRRLYRAIEGEANIAVLFADRPVLLLATNTGSLYLAFGPSSGFLVFASERPILEEFLERRPEIGKALGTHSITRGAPGDAFAIDLNGSGVTKFRLDGADDVRVPEPERPVSVRIVDPVAAAEERRTNLRRCQRCILPETMPGITFDNEGVCSYCRRYKPYKLKGPDALKAIADRHRRTDGRPDCLIALSGGRDSCYGLHVLKRELGLNPIAYTYDWALVTDLARRNQSRLCAKLGVEHVLVSADIQAKRLHIRRNVEAWMAKPDLGMIPLFMAGDKMYFYYTREVARRYSLALTFICGNRFEMTDFKSGFAGVMTDPNAENYRPYDVSASRKLRMLYYYFKNFMRNPRYLNRSVADTALGFYASYLMKHELTRLYDYIPWDEAAISRTLRQDYDWEEASDADTTWRIGDGTAAFYNYIYYTLAGFTEHDTFRSNQIRAGAISRDEALALARRDNEPRFESIREYANMIRFDLDRALAAIDMAPRLY